VLGWVSDFDDLEIVGAFENAMTDAWWLRHTVSGGQHEGNSLILVDDSHRATSTKDQLKGDLMEVDIVRNRSATGDADVGGDDSTSLAIRYEISVVHAGSTGVPGVGCMRDRQGADQGRQIQWGRSVDEVNTHAVWALEVCAIEKARVRGLESQDGRLGRAQFEMQATAEPDESAASRIVSREDFLHTETDDLSEKIESRSQLRD
jgi:hypothetical protein